MLTFDWPDSTYLHWQEIERKTERKKERKKETNKQRKKNNKCERGRRQRPQHMHTKVHYENSIFVEKVLKD